MSKYAKVEDLIKCVAQYIMTDAKRDNYYVCGDIEDYIEFTEAILADLPTIEVSEDCISCKWITDRIICKCFELNDDYTLQQILEDIDNAPSVVSMESEEE